MIKNGDNSEKAQKYLFDGISSILAKDNKSQFDIITLIKAYDALDDKENKESWITEYEKNANNYSRSYNPVMSISFCTFKKGVTVFS